MLHVVFLYLLAKAANFLPKRLTAPLFRKKSKPVVAVDGGRVERRHGLIFFLAKSSQNPKSKRVGRRGAWRWSWSPCFVWCGLIFYSGSAEGKTWPICEELAFLTTPLQCLSYRRAKDAGLGICPSPVLRGAPRHRPPPSPTSHMAAQALDLRWRLAALAGFVGGSQSFAARPSSASASSASSGISATLAAYSRMKSCRCSCASARSARA